MGYKKTYSANSIINEEMINGLVQDVQIDDSDEGYESNQLFSKKGVKDRLDKKVDAARVTEIWATDSTKITTQKAVNIKSDAERKISDDKYLHKDEANVIYLKQTALAAKILDMFYPVGTVYVSYNERNPQVFMGGTWAPIRDVTLVGVGSVFSANSKSARGWTHKHNHEASAKITDTRIKIDNFFQYSSSGGFVSNGYYSVSDNGNKHGAGLGDTWRCKSADITHLHDAKVSVYDNVSRVDVIGQQSNIHENYNMPPFETVYMWRRTN